jgi:hypothetical protein
MTKILSRKCSVPDRSGDIKQGAVDFNSLYAIQMDIETYNYFDVVFKDYRSQNLTRENDKKHDKSDSDMNAGISFLTMDDAPTGLRFKRNNADFMNDFFINIVARSFTNIEDISLSN